MKIQITKKLIFISILFVFMACQNTRRLKDKAVYAPFLQMEYDGIDSVIAEMTLEEKIGQVIFLQQPMYFDKRTDSIKQRNFNEKIQKYLLGGVFLNNIYECKRIDSIHSDLKIPLLIGNHFTGVNHHDFLSNPASLASIRDRYYIENLIEERTNYYQKYGVQILFDANINTITNQDSILQDSIFQLQQADMLKINEHIINNYQNNGIITGVDDCSDFYGVNVDLQPYQKLTYNGLSAILIDSSLYNLNVLKERSVGSVSQYLSDSLDFRGLSFIYINNDESLKSRLKSGIDVFITYGDQLENIFGVYKKAIQNGDIPLKQLEKSVKKILLAKKWSKETLPEKETPSQNDFEERLGKTYDFEAIHAEQTITLVKNENNIVPIKNIQNKKILFLTNYYEKLLFDEYELNVEEHQMDRSFTVNQTKEKDFEKYDYVLVAINENILKFSNDSLIHIKQRLSEIENHKNIVLILQGNAKSLALFQDYSTLIYVPSPAIYHAQLASQVVFGGMRAKGQFPMNISDKIKYGQGEIQDEIFRLRHHVLFNGYDERLDQIDSIVQKGIQNDAMPSCQVMVIKNSKIYYNKAFGYHTYDKKERVKINHLYDLASITKVISTTLAMMRLYDEGKYQLTDSLHQILELNENATIGNITIKELLIHQSGLQANMPIVPFLRNRALYHKKRQENATIHIADNFYMYNNYLDTLWHEIQTLEIGKKAYKYSDVNANILQRVVEKLADEPIDVYVKKHFYEPLLMKRTTYQPLKKFKTEEIVPTEKDDFWRKQLVHGYVHDESAAILGGVAGNAGLFSTVQDLAIVSQMLLNGGTYAGKRYFKEETVKLFTASTHGNHRGLGFNKQTKSGTVGCASQAPMSTYGHTGFTGNCFWVDPENELIYIFLSNRVYPKRNPRLSQQKIRERIHEVVYREMNE